MTSRVIVNKMTTQHKTSVGVTTGIGDVCKTPAPPAPSPVPIPYVAVGNSMMAALGTTMRVNDHMQKVVVKGAKYTMVNGDQPGVALGIISNRIMGASEIKNQSFDVKFEKKGVGRLKDPHGQNCGGQPNTMCPAEMQPPMVGMGGSGNKGGAGGAGGDGGDGDGDDGDGGDQEACDRLKDKQVPGGDRADIAEAHGMLPEHADALSQSCMETGMSATVRKGNPDCLGPIADGFPTKPGGGAGDTISDVANLPDECKGLVGDFDKASGQFKGVNGTQGTIPADEINAARQSMSGDDFKGWMKDKGAWTGDYDLHDVFDSDGSRVMDGSRMAGGGREGEFINSVNDAMGRTDADTRMVQHGPQANIAEHFDNNPDKAQKLRDAFGDEKFERIQKPDVLRDPPKDLLHFDANGEMYKIETEAELKDLYACKGADYPKHW